MMVLAVGRWPWHLSSMHHFDDPVDKITARIGAQVLEAGEPPPGSERVLHADVPISKRFPQMGQLPGGLAC
jgi:hypothetical protein